jgi:hypothetical protein
MLFAAIGRAAWAVNRVYNMITTNTKQCTMAASWWHAHIQKQIQYHNLTVAFSIEYESANSK